MSLYSKSLQILELPEILNLLADECVSDGAKDMAKSLLPAGDVDTVQAQLSETTAATEMMTLKQTPPLSGVKDIRAALRRADMGGVLNTTELLDIAQLLCSAASSISYYRNDKRTNHTDTTAIDYLFETLKPDKNLSDKIQNAIISEEEISDNASRELSDIRRHIRLSGDKVRQTLNKIITSSTYAKALQEPIITMRNNRYVVPVKAEHKSVIPGMVHDISSSGATHFIEPMSVVNINNELRELHAKEKEEIDRILTELSADVAAAHDDIAGDYEVLIKLDFIFAKAKLSYIMNATQPELSSVKANKNGAKRIVLHSARHPLLGKDEAVPVDIRLGEEFDTLIITGPNTGGKTVTLKTLGLLCAMTAAGLHIPVGYGSVVPVFNEILADIGDEQSIEQSLSTFSAHMTNIVSILKECTQDSLLLFDELGAGTDPVEGAALAISVIEHARRSKALIAATTHYAELKEYALRTKGVTNASCEFNVETLKPTYKLIIGIPGRSNAFAISKQLGLPDKIIEDAKSHVSTENTAFEEILQGLEQTRLTLEHERAEAERLKTEIETERQKIRQRQLQLDKERDKHVEIAKREAAVIIEQARQTAREVVDEIRDIQKKVAKNAKHSDTNDEKANLLRRLNEAEDALNVAAPKGGKKTHERPIVAGDRVILDGIGTQADVISVGDDGTISLQAGIMKVTAHIDEVTLVEGKQQLDVKRHIAKSEAKLRTQTVRPELDIRGMNVEEAMPVLVQFIDNAKMAKLSSVTIIHGKGTGVLRKAVHKELKQGSHGIKSLRLGVYGEGEDGVTIAELK